MAQVNNNAESLSRELRKLKNIKSVDFRGLLSGNSESFVNLFRHLFCENNIAFSRYIVEKGYDLSGLTDYKFMESVYKMMRDLFNIKPSINQNQFFSQGFTQRKLEMSTLLAAHVRKLTNELISRVNKKTVQTQSLMKSSLKRPNSAPKQAKVIELGDEHEEDYVKNQSFSINNNRSKKIKSVNKYSDKLSGLNGKSKKNSNIKEHADDINGLSTDSEPSNPANSFNFNHTINPSLDNHQYNNDDDAIRGCDKYHTLQAFREPIEVANVSAYESAALDHESYLRPYQNYQQYTRSDLHDQKVYDVKQYTPRSNDENLVIKKHDNIPGLDKIMQQFDTVIARITLLESRMQRIESKFNISYKPSFDNQSLGHTFYSGQNNQNNQQFSVPHNYHDINIVESYNEKIPNFVRDSRTIISDFESNHQTNNNRNDSNKQYSTFGSGTSTADNLYQPYITNQPGSIKANVEKSSLSCANSAPGSYRSSLSMDLHSSVATVPKYMSSTTNYSEKRSFDVNNLPKDNNAYRITNTSTKYTQPTQKTYNSIPPMHPIMKKSDNSEFDENRQGKSLNFDKYDSNFQSQTDRIASLLSDTQKMLKISEEL